ncbi:MAG: hypothetical protein N3A02_06350, partial [Rectinema sp.]|nr:hypothetical protein [Rectinema sp.]
MEPLLSMEDSQELDRETRTRFQFSSDQLMEIASLRLWEKIRHSLEACASAIATNPKQLSLTAMCGKGDNAGDALAILRHARMDGYNALHAIIP